MIYKDFFIPALQTVEDKKACDNCSDIRAMLMDEISSGHVAPKDTILTVYDDFVGFADHCAFVCDAVSSLFSEMADRDDDDQTVMGLKKTCNSLKARTEKIELALNSLYKSSYTDAHITSIKPHT